MYALPPCPRVPRLPQNPQTLHSFHCPSFPLASLRDATAVLQASLTITKQCQYKVLHANLVTTSRVPGMGHDAQLLQRLVFSYCLFHVFHVYSIQMAPWMSYRSLTMSLDVLWSVLCSILSGLVTYVPKRASITAPSTVFSIQLKFLTVHW